MLSFPKAWHDFNDAPDQMWKDHGNTAASQEHGDILTLWAVVHGYNTKADFPKVLESASDWFGGLADS